MNVAVANSAARAQETFFLIEEPHHREGSSTPLGFWIYLMSDCLIFAMLFATFGVLGGAYAGGPRPRSLFDLNLVALNTAFLLASSITFGFAMLEAARGKAAHTQAWLAVTALLGLAFLTVELHEFGHLIQEGATPQRSAFLSAFFTLVGTHGLHVAFGIVWLATLMTQVLMRGLTAANVRRLVCLSMFWHFLDLIWIGVFSYVYLMGILR